MAVTVTVTIISASDGTMVAPPCSSRCSCSESCRSCSCSCSCSSCASSSESSPPFSLVVIVLPILCIDTVTLLESSWVVVAQLLRFPVPTVERLYDSEGDVTNDVGETNSFKGEKDVGS
eukprot:1229961-Rhodomonas_salina.2